MSTQKPLRQEDYLAMAEENRRLKANQVQLEKPPEVLEQDGFFERRSYLKWVALFGSLVLLSVGLGTAGMRCDARESAHKASSPCYYATQLMRRDNNSGSFDLPSKPWDSWYITECRTLHYTSTVRLTDSLGAPIAFKSKAEAEAFMVSWSLKACP